MKLRLLVLIPLVIVLGGCMQTLLGVRQSDLAAWHNMPVAALDTHPLFLTMPLHRTQAANGMEVRNYRNARSGAAMIGTMLVNISGACNNIFYIRDGCVVEYRPTPSGRARCYTDETTRPQGLWPSCKEALHDQDKTGKETEKPGTAEAPKDDHLRSTPNEETTKKR